MNTSKHQDTKQAAVDIQSYKLVDNFEKSPKSRLELNKLIKEQVRANETGTDNPQIEGRAKRREYSSMQADVFTS